MTPRGPSPALALAGVAMAIKDVRTLLVAWRHRGLSAHDDELRALTVDLEQLEAQVCELIRFVQAVARGERP